jgi:hypothetical protein
MLNNFTETLMRFSIKSFFSSSLFTISVLAVASSMLAGCASPSTSQGMTPASFQTTNKHAQSVTLTVSGGKETGSMGKSQISDVAFAQAITDAITSSKTFSKVIQGNGGDNLLTVTIFNIDQPSFGAAFTVKMEAGWTLKRADTGAVIWQESIKSEHTATMGDAFVGVERLRLANEGAAKENIAQGLSKISALNF